MVELPVGQLLLAVARVTEDNGPLAGEAQVVANEIVRLRDAGHLSKTTAGNIASSIYQRQMPSWHTGDFRVTKPMAELMSEIDRYKRESFPDVQVDPVQVRTRIADIAAGIRLPQPNPEDLPEIRRRR